ncbi:MAG: hypothetical protein AAFW98_08020 [Pseudomonadota bacterium]
MLDTLTLHIGHPKTGTTSLQATFRDNAALLARHGLYYFGGHRNNHPIARQLHRSSQHARDARVTERFEKGLAETDCAQAFMSSETLIRLSLDEANDAVAKYRRFAHQVRVLAYVRHPVSTASSLAHQAIRTGRALADVEASPRVLPLKRILSRWGGAVGRDNLIVRPFDRRLLVGGDIVDDVLDTLGVGAAAPDMARVRQNDPLSVVAAHLLNSAQRIEPERDLAIPSMRVFDAIGGPRYVLPLQSQERVRQEAAEDMAFLRDEFSIVLPEPSDAPSPPPELTPEVMETLGRALYRLSQYAYAVDRSPMARLFGVRSPYSTAWDASPHPLAPLMERLGVTRRLIGRELRADRPALKPDDVEPSDPGA